MGNKALELTGGREEQGIDLQSFLGLVAYNKARRQGFSQENVALLRSVFDAYDFDRSGVLEGREYSELLADLGHVPRTKQESEDLGMIVAQCRRNGLPGPLRFAEFLVLARKLDLEPPQGGKLQSGTRLPAI